MYFFVFLFSFHTIQVQQQVTDRIAALEKVIETQRATMEEALSGIKEQLEEARGDLDYINQRME